MSSSATASATRVARLGPIFVMLLGACGNDEPAAVITAAPRPVRVAAVVDTVAVVTVSAAGTLGAREELPLAFKVGGVVQRVLVNAGDRVRAGQLLAQIDPAEIDAGVAKARAGVEKAERDLQRLERLLADSVVTRTQVDDARTAAEVARAELRAVAFNRGRAVITAPAAGIVLRRQVEPGQLIDPGATVFVFGSGARGQAFRTGLADRDAVRVHAGDVADIQFEALPGRTFAAVVAELAGAATPGTGTYNAVLAVRGADDLPSGLVGRAVIRLRSADTAKVVPIEALLEADAAAGTVFVYHAPSGTARRRSVRIAALDGRRVAVSEGLDDARQVITDGAAYLNDGDAVAVIP